MGVFGDILKAVDNTIFNRQEMPFTTLVGGGSADKLNVPIANAVQNNKMTIEQARQMQDLGYVPEWKAMAEERNRPKRIVSNGNSSFIDPEPNYAQVLGTQSAPSNGLDISSILEFVNSYPGSRIDEGYLNLLAQNAKDVDTLKRVIAASVSETGMGKNAYSDIYNPNKENLRESNYWGWFPGGDRSYDPTREEMAKIITDAYGPGGPYENMTPENIARYTGNDRSSNWQDIYNWAYGNM